MIHQPIIPEVIEPDESLPKDLLALRELAWWLDAAFPIPGFRRRVGIAPALGLIPGLGDAIGALLGVWIVVGGIRHRVPGSRVARMVLNILTDLIVGTIPFLGDIFDFLFQENLSNVKILLEERDRLKEPRSMFRVFAIASGVILLIASFAVFTTIAAIAMFVWISQKLYVMAI